MTAPTLPDLKPEQVTIAEVDMESEAVCDLTPKDVQCAEPAAWALNWHPNCEMSPIRFCETHYQQYLDDRKLDIVMEWFCPDCNQKFNSLDELVGAPGWRI